MIFNSYLFLIGFFPAALLIYWLLPERHRRVWLVTANIIFYSYAGLDYLLLLLVMTGVTFVAMRVSDATDDAHRKRLALAVALSNLLTLALFKYGGFFTAGRFLSLVELVLPLGISYYTFNLISYSLDVHNRRIPAETNLLNFAAYATFFPTIASGPLLRYRNFTSESPTVSKLELGLFYFVIGLAKKLIIADQIGMVINPLLDDYESLQFWGAWLVTIGYTYQLYFDFSGYTDMAIGIGTCFGFRLPPNFNAPFTSRNITEFWQRWHISLSNWFRDYVFFPTSRGLLKRTDRRNPDMVRTASLMVTMTLTGLWHGANWTFIVWGAVQGVMLAIHAQTRANRWRAWPAPLARMATFLAFALSLVIFRSTSLGMAFDIYSGLLGLNGFELTPLDVPGVTVELLILLAGLFLVTNIDKDTTTIQPRYDWIYATGIAMILTICLLFLDQTSPFLYVQF